MNEPDPQNPGPEDAGFEDPAPQGTPGGEASAPPQAAPKRLGGRWRLTLDVLLFQGKLALDALRDLFLSPISIVLALYGALTDARDPGRYFYWLMRWGRRSDHFIDLFSAGRNPDEHDTDATLDDIVGVVETVIVDEEKRGGMTAEARLHIERALHQIEQATVPERQRLSWRVKRAAVHLRREARKVRDQISSRSGEGSGSSS